MFFDLDIKSDDSLSDLDIKFGNSFFCLDSNFTFFKSKQLYFFNLEELIFPK